MARHEKGVSFWEVESIAKGWKPGAGTTTVSETEPVPPSLFICSISTLPFPLFPEYFTVTRKYLGHDHVLALSITRLGGIDFLPTALPYFRFRLPFAAS